MSVSDYISEINEKEGINLAIIVKSFEKKLKTCFKLYEEKSGFEDYKMNDYDYIVLYTLWKFIGNVYSIEEYLVIMYSYYKIEEFYFPVSLFRSKKCIDIITNTGVSSILDKLIKF